MPLTTLLSRIGLIAIVVATYASLAGTPASASAATGGQNSQSPSGYAISSVSYHLNPANPANIDSLSFTAAGGARPTTAQVRLSPSSSYKTCTVSGTSSPWAVSCSNNGAFSETVREAVQLDVLLAQ